MEKIKIKDIEEYVYYEKLENGLEVYLYTKDNLLNMVRHIMSLLQLMEIK